MTVCRCGAYHPHIRCFDIFESARWSIILFVFFFKSALITLNHFRVRARPQWWLVLEVPRIHPAYHTLIMQTVLCECYTEEIIFWINISHQLPDLYLPHEKCVVIFPPNLENLFVKVEEEKPHQKVFLVFFCRWTHNDDQFFRHDLHALEIFTMMTTGCFRRMEYR